MSAYTSLLHRWFDQVWHEGKEEAIDILLDENAVIHGLDTDAGLSGPSAFKPFFRSFRAAFPVIRVELEHLVQTEETEVAWCRVHGISADGKQVFFEGITVAKFNDGRIIEGWNAFDFLKMQQQLGYKLVPETRSYSVAEYEQT